MDKGFIDILQRLIAEQGKEAMLNQKKCKAFLADYTRGEYKKESRLLLQALEAGAQKAIDAAEDVALCKKQQVRVLREEYFLAEEVAADVVDALALVLRGDTTITQVETPKAEATPKPEAAPQPIPKPKPKSPPKTPAPQPAPAPQPKPQPAPQPAPAPQSKPQPAPQPAPQPKPQPAPQPKPAPPPPPPQKHTVRNVFITGVVLLVVIWIINMANPGSSTAPSTTPPAATASTSNQQTSNSGQSSSVASQPPASSGQSTPASYTITYNINGGSGTTPTVQPVNAGASINLHSGSGLTRSGYTFGGWNTRADGTGVNFSAGSSVTTDSNAILYAKWDPVPRYTVTYNANGGSGTATAQEVNAGSGITLHNGSGFTRSGYTFGGWNTNSGGTGTNYNAGSSYTPSSTITLYARWNPVAASTSNSGSTGASTAIPATGDITVPGNTLAAKLDWLQTNAQSNRSHIVEVSANENISRRLEYSGKSNVTITLRGSGSNRTIGLPGNYNVFAVGSGVTLVLDNNITLQGRSNNGNNPVVYVDTGGTLRMNNGSTITGNTSGAVGGGVYVQTGGTFTMSGGTITGNTANTGGGVGVNTGGTFTKTGGTITGTGTNNGNTARTSNGGHAVYVSSSIRREATAETGINMSYNGRANPPTYSGAWTPQTNF